MPPGQNAEYIRALWKKGPIWWHSGSWVKPSMDEDSTDSTFIPLACDFTWRCLCMDRTLTTFTWIMVKLCDSQSALQPWAHQTIIPYHIRIFYIACWGLLEVGYRSYPCSARSSVWNTCSQPACNAEMHMHTKSDVSIMDKYLYTYIILYWCIYSFLCAYRNLQLHTERYAQI